MKLQANYNGAWRNVALPIGGATIESDPPVEVAEQLKSLSEHLCQGAHGLRIVDGRKVLWTWTAEGGWKRPHWYKEGA